MRTLPLLSLLLFACSTQVHDEKDGGGQPETAADLRSPGGGGGPDLRGAGGAPGCPEVGGCYTVYAHSDHVLYHVDLKNKQLVTIGPFKAPQVKRGKHMVEDVITDLAVSPDDVIYTISETNLYTADPKDGHVTLVGPVTACGTYAVALTFLPDGSLYAADYQGAFCKIDLGTRPPTVTQIGTIGGGMAIAGDLVAVKDGTLFGTAYKLGDKYGSGTDLNNLLVKIDPQTGQARQVLGATGYPELFGVAFELGQVFAFTHDGSGDVVTVDPKTGKGTLYNTFKDPDTGQGISFAGAGVNSMVQPPPLG